MSYLDRVTRRASVDARKIMIYGPPGGGKSTFASTAPSPIVAQVEQGGVDDIDVPRTPPLATWADVVGVVDELSRSAHPYRTLVIDSLTALDPLAKAALCATDRDRPDTVEKYEKGYNKWRSAIVERVWTPWLDSLERLRVDRDITIVLLAHATIRSRKDPESEGWQETVPHLAEPMAVPTVAWCDAVLWLGPEETRVGERGVWTGRRVLHATHSATRVAKARFAIDDVSVIDRVPDAWDRVFARRAPIAPPEDPSAIPAWIAEHKTAIDALSIAEKTWLRREIAARRKT